MKKPLLLSLFALCILSSLSARAQCCEKVYALEDSLIQKFTQLYWEEIVDERCKWVDKGIYVLTITDHGDGGKSYSYKYLYDDRFKANLPNKWSYMGKDILLIYDGTTGCEVRNEPNIENMLTHIGDRVYINPPKSQQYTEYRLDKNYPYVMQKFESVSVGNASHNIIYLVDKQGRLVKKIRPA
ncbi:MAG: hypothetical protein KKG00_04145 [Bacteroidetes bacterium]|nr:hypothetical protein [Bacteroidota bacterium]